MSSIPRTLFVLAHPDDEAFGPGGTIAKLAKIQPVFLLILCNGAKLDAKQVAPFRQQALQKSCEILGVTDYQIEDTPDLELEYKATTGVIERCIKVFRPTTIFTNNISDINMDHRVTAEACLIAARPTSTSTVKQLFMSEIASSTSWSFGQFGDFVPNMYVDISTTINQKVSALERYTTELREYPDARSLKATIHLAQYRGNQVNVEYAEAFKQIFSIS